MTHPLPLRAGGAWAPLLIASAALLAPKPGRTSWEEAAAFPVPALTAEQVLSEALELRDGDDILVHGAGGVTGGMLVALASLRQATVIATAGPSSAARVRELGARHVLDYHDEDWPEQVLALTQGAGVCCAANAARGGATHAIRAVADGGRLATITSDPPVPVPGIAVSNVYVRPDGAQLRVPARQLASGQLGITVGAAYPLDHAAEALALAIRGAGRGAVVAIP